MKFQQLRTQLTETGRHLAQETYLGVHGSPGSVVDQAFNSAVFGYLQGASMALDCAGADDEADRKKLMFAAAMAFGRGWRDCGGEVPAK